MFLPSKLADAFEELQAAKKNRAPTDYVVATGFLYRVVGKRGHENTAHAPKGADDDVVHGSVARRGFGGMRVTVCRVVSGGDRRNVRRRVVIRCSVHGFPMVCPSNRLQCFLVLESCTGRRAGCLQLPESVVTSPRARACA